MKQKLLLLLVLFFIGSEIILSQSNSLKIATWNIEHLGSSGRGFPEYKNLESRTQKDLKKIAHLIKEELKLDIVAIQEVAVSHQKGKKSYSNKLESIVNELGEGWKYYLASVNKKLFSLEMQNAFIYDSRKVNLVLASEMEVPKFEVGEKSLFDRAPLVGYFEIINDKVRNKGFLITNLHLASGKHNDSNHLAAMVIVEQNLKTFLKKHKLNVRERDRIILGDFNDNPFQLDSNGKPEFIPTMYHYMKLKGYKDFVDASFESTRMNKKFNSIIDHFLISKSLQRYVEGSKATMYVPDDRSQIALLNWRKSYSDHFPIFVEFLFR